MNHSIYKGLQRLNARLQASGFSWQHDDYFLLQEALPEIIKFVILGDPIVMSVDNGSQPENAADTKGAAD